MQHLIFSHQAQALDLFAQKLGLDIPILMEVAGLRMWERIRSHFPHPNTPFFFLVGPGHNGGDALVVARHAWTAGYRNLKLHVPVSTLKPTTQKQLDILQNMGLGSRIVVSWNGDLQPSTVVIEGLSGAGRLPQHLDGLIAKLNELNNPKIALDLPCGLGQGNTYHATLTLSVAPLKVELFIPQNRCYCGTIETIEMPWPLQELGELERSTNITLVDLDDLVGQLASLRPQPWDHKGKRGRVGIWAGQAEMLGAGKMASLAAIQVAGVVEWHVHEKDLPAAQMGVLGPLTRIFDPDRLAKLADTYQSILVGPGLDPETALEIVNQLGSTQADLVLDAGALSPNVLSLLTNKRRVILTPHPGEMARLMRVSVEHVLKDPAGVLKQVPEHAIVVLKSQPLWISFQGQHWVLDTNNPALGFGGSGDILAGLMAGLAARLEPLEAVFAAVALHQKAAQVKTRWLNPEILLMNLSQVLAEVWSA